ncbi:FtsK/SpoIIIE domain-containing protein [Fontisphaera persica]|uniref:FtsK/SpoIIIE domain-containing protein n=1 Tax=Fontisphaera persica TaxID=2974023 RepID=UPI0024C01643|nr:FtsK/SpoIIIE domain-containing protein [Fontisphaera persica]WCJ59332.1 FtsK/SpoIIIE domain-containing protein [Fontisphaera persica]
MSNPLTIPQTLDLLERLKTLVRDCARREEQLLRDERQKRDAIERHHRTAREELETWRAAEESKIRTRAEAQQAALEQRHRQRLERIRRGHRPSKAYALKRIEDHEGRQKVALQKAQMEAARNREQALAQNDATLAAFHEKLGGLRAEFETLEQHALRVMSGYGRFKKMLTGAGLPEEPEPAGDEYPLLEKLEQLRGQVEADLRQFRRRPAAWFYRLLPVWVQGILLVALGAGLPPLLHYFKAGEISWSLTGGVAGALLAGTLVWYFLSRNTATPEARKIAQALERARRWHNAALNKAQARHAAEVERIETALRLANEEINRRWQEATEEAARLREFWPQEIDRKLGRVMEHHEQLSQRRLQGILQQRETALQQLQQEYERRLHDLEQHRAERTARLNAETDALWAALMQDWQAQCEPLLREAQAAAEFARQDTPPWEPPFWEHWTPPETARNRVKFGQLEVDLRLYAEGAPKDPRLPMPGGGHLSLPLWLLYPQQGCLLFETHRTGGAEAIAAINNILFRLLATTPPGKLSFTIIDPVKLGQNFAGIMHLADYEDNLINGRIWTQTTQIEERLKDLTEHMEKVIQMYLRNEYETIAEYNAQAGKIAEKYHFVIIADFPMNFSDAAAKRLLHIASSGARCGVYTLIHWDHRYPATADLAPDVLRKNSVCIQRPGDFFTLARLGPVGVRLQLDPPPPAELATAFLHQVGELSRGANRVEVPFEQVAPAPEEVWALDTAEELRVPIGRSGATKLQFLAIGRGTKQHALVAGKTGSGKSTLFHVIITNLARWASPEQVEFYLVDFKKGVEFKCYAQHRLPHARVVAIESDREFGLSVLQRLDEELRRRGDLFRQAGVQDLAGYRRAGGPEKLPRTLLLIDEFQEFFVEDDRIAQTAAVLLDRIVRQGRAFGIHVILGSQTLGGAYTLARTTMGQMVIRIALQCNEADAYLIMDENNAAPRLLSRPGEGIYNDAAGALEGNSPFQTVWLPEDERDQVLAEVRARADRETPQYTGPVVFEGNAPADVRDNHALKALLAQRPTQTPPLVRLWLGAPNSIKGPTEVVFQRRSGNNLLIVGQRDEAILTLVTVGAVSLAAHYPPGAARFYFLDASPPETPPRQLIEQLSAIIPHPFTLAKSGDLGDLLGELARELRARTDTDAAQAPEIFVFLHGLQNFKKLKVEDEFAFSMDSGGEASPSAQLSQLITEGPTHGIHLIVAVDTYNNVNRFLGRKALSEFEMRVLFQMSANDSASLCDDPGASHLGLHCGLFYNEQEGYLEKFRPYAVPDRSWWEQAARALRG